MENNENQVTEEKAKSQKNLKKFLWSMAGVILLALVVVLSVGVYRAYGKVSTDKFTLAVAKLLKLPAFKINGQPVLFFDYVTDLKAIHKMKEYSNTDEAKQENQPPVNLTEEQMSDQVLLRLADNYLVNEVAKSRAVAVEPKDVEEFKTKFLQSFKDVNELNAQLQKRYGWDMPMFEVKVIRPFLLKNKLAQAVSSDEPARAEIKAAALDILNKIKAGADFSEMAKQYGQDGTASLGGELGWFQKGAMVPEFETAVFGLKKGELGSSLVETRYGYHIVRVEDKKMEKVKDSDGKTGNQESVQARHILFTYPSLDKLLNELALKAQINLYVRVHDPFKTPTTTTGR